MSNPRESSSSRRPRRYGVLRSAVSSSTEGTSGSRSLHNILLSQATMDIVRQRRRRLRQPGTTSHLFDNRTEGYEWLLAGWVVEERRMPHGRLYRYYYDPMGNMYYTREEVLYAWDVNGMVLIED